MSQDNLAKKKNNNIKEQSCNEQKQYEEIQNLFLEILDYKSKMKLFLKNLKTTDEPYKYFKENIEILEGFKKETNLLRKYFYKTLNKIEDPTLKAHINNTTFYTEINKEVFSLSQLTDDDFEQGNHLKVIEKFERINKEFNAFISGVFFSIYVLNKEIVNHSHIEEREISSKKELTIDLVDFIKTNLEDCLKFDPNNILKQIEKDIEEHNFEVYKH